MGRFLLVLLFVSANGDQTDQTDHLGRTKLMKVAEGGSMPELKNLLEVRRLVS